MSTGFGASGWGAGPWGGGVEVVGGDIDVTLQDALSVADSTEFSTPLRVESAFAPDAFSVVVVFSNDLDISYPPLSDPSNYTIAGLTVLAVTVLSFQTVKLTTTPEQTASHLYTVVVADAISTNGDSLGPDDSANFLGFLGVPTFLAGAESPTKVEVVFSTAMQIDGNFLNPANYTITRVTGSVSVPVLSVTASGPTPRRRATLELGSELESKEYYAIVLSPLIVSVIGVPPNPDTYIFQWGDMTRPLNGVPLEVLIRDFSGEVSGGLLGNPAGQVFFSPAFEAVTANSTIELEQVSVCTKAYDEYFPPNPPDPPTLFTFGPGIGATTGPGFVLWAPADRLGQARLDLTDRRLDTAPQAYDSPAYGTLVETIDITKASFLNDTRWETFPGTITFKTASNLTPIGPGPTTEVTLDWPKVEASDSFPVTDTVSTV